MPRRREEVGSVEASRVTGAVTQVWSLAWGPGKSSTTVYGTTMAVPQCNLIGPPSLHIEPENYVATTNDALVSIPPLFIHPRRSPILPAALRLE